MINIFQSAILTILKLWKKKNIEKKSIINLKVAPSPSRISHDQTRW